MAYSGLADTYLALGNLEQALGYAQSAWQTAKEIGAGRELGISCSVLGMVLLALGETPQAKIYFEQSIPLLEEAKEYEDLVRTRRGLELALSQLSAGSS